MLHILASLFHAVETIVLAFLIFWVLYLAYCTLNVAHQNGKLAKAPWYVRWTSFLVLAGMYVFDVVFNYTLAALLFKEKATWDKRTFTQRCESHLDDPGWRGDYARWVCEGWLNPFENHCHR